MRMKRTTFDCPSVLGFDLFQEALIPLPKIKTTPVWFGETPTFYLQNGESLKTHRCHFIFYSSVLFNRNTLRKVLRLIYIAAS